MPHKVATLQTHVCSSHDWTFCGMATPFQVLVEGLTMGFVYYLMSAYISKLKLFFHDKGLSLYPSILHYSVASSDFLQRMTK